MEKVYLMAGKRFGTDGTVASLDSHLAKYGLVVNALDKTTPESVRRVTDSIGDRRYDIEHSFGDAADEPRDYCVGVVIGKTGYGLSKVIETELIGIEKALEKVKEDIPEASILAFSHWI